MRSIIKISVGIVSLAIVAIIASYFYLPVNRVGITSELIMLGDLNSDNRWDTKDKALLNNALASPFSTDSLTQTKIDLNRNELIDEEDLLLLDYIYKYSDPYLAEKNAKAEIAYYPRPRELFKYLPKYEYVQRPLFLLKHGIADDTPFTFLADLHIQQKASNYKEQLFHEIYNEAIRFTFAYVLRKDKLTELESDYVKKKIQHCDTIYFQSEYYELLLELISLVEDAETLTTKTQSDFIKNILYFRDRLRELLVSKEYKSFELGKISYIEILKIIESDLKSILDISLNLNTLSSPRDFLDLRNYIERAEWQTFKSKTKNDDFKRLALYAQYDRRYLRAVSKTSPKLKDIRLKNHNLPMVLIFREALRIKNNDKKAAVGLLDEAVRIPLGWVKSIPKALLPSSVALENFLLPGNKEDGSDKSRHWNVFGGVAIYKSPKESLVLSLKREIMDLRNQDYSQEAMQEFIRDTIANISGIYYVVSIDPSLLTKMKGL